MSEEKKVYPVSLDDFPFRTNFARALDVMREKEKEDPNTKQLVVSATDSGRVGYRIVPQKVVWKLRRSGVEIDVLY